MTSPTPTVSSLEAEGEKEAGFIPERVTGGCADAGPCPHSQEADRLREQVFRPGVMRCAKCSFRLIRNVLYVASGTVGAGTSETEPCPNGCGPLWPVTWKDECKASDECWEQQVERAVRAEAERDAALEALRPFAEIYRDHMTKSKYGPAWGFNDGTLLHEDFRRAADLFAAKEAANVGA